MQSQKERNNLQPTARIREKILEHKKRIKLDFKNVIRSNEKQARGLEGGRKIFVYLPYSTFCHLVEKCKNLYQSET